MCGRLVPNSERSYDLLLFSENISFWWNYTVFLDINVFSSDFGHNGCHFRELTNENQHKMLYMTLLSATLAFLKSHDRAKMDFYMKNTLGLG